MIEEIKNRIEQELDSFTGDLRRLYSLDKVSPLLFKNINNFITRKGKRVRPILFVISYLGFAKRRAPGLYRSALSIELLHDFMLVHDDVIDKSETRRGKPSMHKMLNDYLSGFKNIKFSGQDLTIVIGDVMFAMAIHAFLSIREDRQRKEVALKKLAKAALYTGSGEFLELLCGIKNIDKMTKAELYKIYDFKTANYTFASPLSIGAILAGAKDREVDKLFNYGIYLGRAFQIKDDILGLFSEERKTGKPILTDLQEGKKTILIWQAYHNSGTKEKTVIKAILAKKSVNISDLLKMRAIVIGSGALEHAKKEICLLLNKAEGISASCGMRKSVKALLNNYSREILDL